MLSLARDGYSRPVDLSDPASCEVGRMDCAFKRDRDGEALKISRCAARLSRRGGVDYVQVTAVKAPLKVRTPHGGEAVIKPDESVAVVRGMELIVRNASTPLKIEGLPSADCFWSQDTEDDDETEEEEAPEAQLQSQEWRLAETQASQ